MFMMEISDWPAGLAGSSCKRLLAGAVAAARKPVERPPPRVCDAEYEDRVFVLLERDEI